MRLAPEFYVGILLLVIGLLFFGIGMHNIDNSWNMRYVECAFDTTMLDYNLLGEGATVERVYVQGVFLTELGMLLTVIGLIITIGSVKS